MQKINLKELGQIEVIFISIIIISVSLTTHFNKELFVSKTGKISFFGDLGILYILGLFLKWKYIREIMIFNFLYIIPLIALIIYNNSSKLNTKTVFLFGIMIEFLIAFYFLAFSKNLKSYLSDN
ncbi:MAG: hypothetical protein IPL95_19120 [Saprospiraceae bacterium]|nr:hypothetical protein [Saprospiraceae bacterium]